MGMCGVGDWWTLFGDKWQEGMMRRVNTLFVSYLCQYYIGLGYLLVYDVAFVCSYVMYLKGFNGIPKMDARKMTKRYRSE